MSERFDIAVIGCGVVGLAILRRLAMSGLKAVALEKGADILSGASKGNSALLHTGFDAPPKSLELKCMQAGYAEYLDIRQNLNLPLLETSAIIAAWNEEEKAKLEGIEKKARANGVNDVKQLSPTELRIREPQLSRNALGGLLVPGEHVIDPWSAPLAYAHQAIAHGAKIIRKAEVTAARFEKDAWHLTTAQGEVTARIVINAAGLYGDKVEALARTPSFEVKPRKGQFVVFDKPAAKLLRAILLPVPTARTKGVVLFRTIFGNLAIGPTAEETDERENATTDTATLEKLKARAIEMLPALKDVDVTALYAGLRPATQQSEYIIEADEKQNWITAAGIRSTGLTGSLGIAQHVSALYAKHFGKLPKKLPPPKWTPVPNLAEHAIRPYMKGGEIICHCEWVTRGEIEAATKGPLPAGDLAGLKRRTRATMGRCQGFYCAQHVSAAFEKAKHGAS
ncbi:NAD(P)/FAD-dependent oxidoreductase [Aestuariivirga litoralis]|uniref:NAD(P)/FAD-dependent oxidoreductase n=1 Tax=Aestuariivirga litoralis TaxID=2650924 RepID=UPI0018C7D67F|nr:NAD(P)/FAD-dependent oxidoreductase [Aestuariivirga litoralis]MBG1232714.1 NAD(P)/FAD-dependent oxidoreductase [Aestuariivirga litoralis]